MIRKTAQKAIEKEGLANIYVTAASKNKSSVGVVRADL
jgi:hypothetical protein